MSGPSSPSTPPFLTFLPPGAPGPLVISVPHAGRFYPDPLEAARAVAWTSLHDLEDRYADRLIGPAVAGGATAIVATHARAWLDLNRHAEDREDAPASPHGRAGLGIVPQRLGGRALWRAATPKAEVDARVASCHRPYHAAIAAALAAARATHGYALLIDCHSMPPILVGGGRGARLVIGDRHGASAAAGVVDAVFDMARRGNLQPARNTPYAGAYTLDRHGRPERNIHAVQLEIDRGLYLEARLREPSDGLEPAARLFARLCAAALDAASPPSERLAAE